MGVPDSEVIACSIPDSYWQDPSTAAALILLEPLMGDERCRRHLYFGADQPGFDFDAMRREEWTEAERALVECADVLWTPARFRSVPGVSPALDGALLLFEADWVERLVAAIRVHRGLLTPAEARGVELSTGERARAAGVRLESLWDFVPLSVWQEHGFSPVELLNLGALLKHIGDGLIAGER